MSTFFAITGALAWTCFGAVAVIAAVRIVVQDWHKRVTLKRWAQVFEGVFVEPQDKGVYRKLVKRALAGEKTTPIRDVWRKRPSMRAQAQEPPA